VTAVLLMLYSGQDDPISPFRFIAFSIFFCNNMQVIRLQCFTSVNNEFVQSNNISLCLVILHRIWGPAQN